MASAQQIRGFAKALITGTLDFEFEYMPYRLYNVSAHKLLALLRSEINRVRRRPKEPWYPPQLMAEVSAVCDLHCPLCPSAKHIPGSGRGIMSFDTFRTLIDDFGDYATIAILWMWGEPFLNRKLPDMVSYARSRNLATVTSTNGQHIQTREDAEGLVASGLDNLIVAVDGGTQETYGRYRIGGEIGRIHRLLELISEAKRSLGSSKPGVNVRTVVTKHNEHELAEIERIAVRYGAEMVSRKRVSSLDYQDPDSDKAFNPSSSAYRRQKLHGGLSEQRSRFRCRRPWSRLSARWDGTVLSCEFDVKEIAPFGRGGHDMSFREVWSGDAAREFRRGFSEDMNAYPFCASCPYGGRSPQECTAEMIHLKH